MWIEHDNGLINLDTGIKICKPFDYYGNWVVTVETNRIDKVFHNQDGETTYVYEQCMHPFDTEEEAWAYYNQLKVRLLSPFLVKYNGVKNGVADFDFIKPEGSE
jgi:hypothetical protein